MDFKHRNWPLFYRISIFVFLVITVSALVLTLSNFSNQTLPYLDTRHSSSAKFGFRIQEPKSTSKEAKGENIVGKKTKQVWVMRMSATIRRLLISGPGSSPPRCKAKCGRCSPCKPVHVSVPPGTSVTTEYYPEAWRCKCGNKLYMP